MKIFYSDLQVGSLFLFFIALLQFLLVTLASPSLVAAEPLSTTAQKYYYGIGVSKSFQKAFTLYLEAARAGDVAAMFVVGGMYMKGQGVESNPPQGFRWLYRAAIEGRSSKESQRILGQFFLTGQGVPQNYSEALRWYERAAQGGDREAQSELAFLYFSGNVVARDYEKALYWFELAARNGYPLAQYNVGMLWYTGNGVATVDMVQAYAWFNLAAANGSMGGYYSKKYLETILSADELRKAQDMSTVLYRDIAGDQKAVGGR